jgi:hypothetical protein
MTDKLRRCLARSKYGHRCRKPLLHGGRHRAFGLEWD